MCGNYVIATNLKALKENALIARFFLLSNKITTCYTSRAYYAGSRYTGVYIFKLAEFLNPVELRKKFGYLKNSLRNDYFSYVLNN